MSRVTGDGQRRPEAAGPVEAGGSATRGGEGASSQDAGVSAAGGNQAILANELAANVVDAGEAALPAAPPSPAVDPIHAGEIAIASLLRWGVAASGLLLVLALAGSLLSGVPLGSRLLPLGQLFGGGHALPPVLAQLGLITLAVTPLARVALAAGVFARAGEKRETLVALGVLALLAVALLLGAAEG